MLLLVKALKVMYVGVPSGGIISAIIPLAFKTTANLWSLINIISLEEQRKMSHGKNKLLLFDEFLVSKETVVLRRWERLKQKFGFIK